MGQQKGAGYLLESREQLGTFVINSQLITHLQSFHTLEMHSALFQGELGYKLAP
jgi:hypothetical protein